MATTNHSLPHLKSHSPSRRMAFIACLFLLAVFGAKAQTVNMDFPAQSLEARLNKIISESKYSILFDSNTIQNVKVPAYTAKNKKWEQIIEASLSGTSYTAKKNGNSYNIVRKPVQVQKKTGSIKGSVLDAQGTTLPGASIVVLETGTSASTDTSGNFTLNLPVGTYTIEVSYISYQSQIITGVVVTEGNTTALSVALKVESEALSEVIVIQTYQKATSSVEGLLQQQKRAAQMSDGISAEQISKTPDSDVGATLKRITGITTVDNKYVVVRSMGERWNTAAMDGINLPSTEAYNQNFSFDIIPTAMVESVIVSKTSTPDMNANFAGGYVEVRTKDIPEKDFFSFSTGTNFNDRTTFKEFLTRERGKNDFLGYDDGTRDFPKGLVSMSWDNPKFFEQSRQFKNDNFTTYGTTANPGTSFQLAMGKSFSLNKDKSNKWGFAAAATFRNEQSKLEIDHTGRGGWMDTAGVVGKPQLEGTEPVPFFNFKNKGASYSYNSTLAGMFNMGLQLGNHRISLRNTYTHIYENTLTRVTGWDEYTNSGGGAAEASYNFFYHGIIPNNDPSQLSSLEQPRTDNTDYPIYQTLLQNKLEGKHKIGNTELAWFAARTGVSSDIKDLTQHQTFHSIVGGEIMAYHQIYNSGNNFTRAYIESQETDYNYGVSFKWKIERGNFKNDIKIGYAGVVKNNTNQQEKFFLRVDENRNVPNSEKNQLTISGSLAHWFDGSKYVPGGIGWQTRPLYENSLYEGKVTQHAPYIMFDNNWNKKLRLVWGLRAEYFRYDLISQQLDEADPRNVYKQPIEDKPWQWMPSANFTYSPISDINLRLAYSKSVIRPQFNERTGLPYFDPIANGLIYNTEMTSSVIDNYDFKFEWFPGAGEIISASLYYKDLDRPIEREGFISSEGNLYLYNGNSKNAKLKGFEIEVRKNFSFIAKSTFLEDLFVTGNFTLNDTKVTAFKDQAKTGAGAETYEVERPLYGQTPYAYNLGLLYNGERLGAGFFYNAKGDQYITVGYDYLGEEIQRAYAVADMQISYKLLKDKNLELKFNVKNLFDAVKEYYNNYNSYSVSKGVGSEFSTVRENLSLLPGSTNKYDKNVDRLLFRAYNGRTFGFSLTYNF